VPTLSSIPTDGALQKAKTAAAPPNFKASAMPANTGAAGVNAQPIMFVPITSGFIICLFVFILLHLSFLNRLTIVNLNKMIFQFNLPKYFSIL
jgi:hypothetical protein